MDSKLNQQGRYAPERSRKHYNAQERATYQCWRDMKGRCYNQNSQRYYTHGARGISVCPAWRDDFNQFVADMGWKPPGYTLDRIDNNSHYSCDNCRWATPKEQAANRRTNVWLTHDGKTMTLGQWATELGISNSALTKRLQNNPTQAFSPEYFGNQVISDEVKHIALHRLESEQISQSQLARELGCSQSAISKWKLKNANLKTP